VSVGAELTAQRGRWGWTTTMVWGYLKSELQALPLEPDHNYSVGRKLDSDLVLKVRRPACLTRLSRALLNT